MKDSINCKHQKSLLYRSISKRVLDVTIVFFFPYENVKGWRLALAVCPFRVTVATQYGDFV